MVAVVQFDDNITLLAKHVILVVIHNQYIDYFLLDSISVIFEGNVEMQL
jgi:hypothetical protein